MKRTLALAVAAASVATASNALAAGPTLYGKLNITAHQYDLERVNFAEGSNTGATSSTDELDQFAVESNGSRLGIKGDFDLGNGLAAVYNLEYGVDADNGTGSNGREFNQRNIYAGIKGSWGTILAGKNDSPLKTAQTNNILKSDIDRFNDSALADIGTYLVGENRPDNVIQYNSPVLFNGFEVKIAAVQAEEDGVSDDADDNDFATGTSVALSYGQSSWFVAAAFDNNVAATDAVRLVGEVVVGPVKIGAIYQTAERHDREDSLGGYSNFVGSAGANNPLDDWDGSASARAYKEQDGFVLNAAWNIQGPWTLKGQIGRSTTTPTNDAYDDVDIDAIAIGVDYAFNANARIYGYYAALETEGDNAVSTDATEDKTFAIGFDFKF
jgi:predicted porin